MSEEEPVVIKSIAVKWQDEFGAIHAYRYKPPKDLATLADVLMGVIDRIDNRPSVLAMLVKNLVAGRRSELHKNFVDAACALLADMNE